MHFSSDNHSLMKVYTHKLETQSFQRMCGFPQSVDNKGLSFKVIISQLLKNVILAKSKFFLYQMTAEIILKYSSWS